MAFPSISTGAYGYPIEDAGRIALAEIRSGLQDHPTLEQVIVVCFEKRVLRLLPRRVSGNDLRPDC